MSRRLEAADGALALLAVLLVVQMWLLTATLELDLAGQDQVPLPAAVLSGLLFAACVALGLLAERIHSRPE